MEMWERFKKLEGYADTLPPRHKQAFLILLKDTHLEIIRAKQRSPRGPRPKGVEDGAHRGERYFKLELERMGWEVLAGYQETAERLSMSSATLRQYLATARGATIIRFVVHKHHRIPLRLTRLGPNAPKPEDMGPGLEIKGILVTKGGKPPKPWDPRLGREEDHHAAPFVSPRGKASTA